MQIVLMAKLPLPGTVKSRLVRDGVSPQDAAKVAQAMLECMVERLAQHGEVILAIAPDDSFDRYPEKVRRLVSGWMNQGAGDLGERISRIWRVRGQEQALAFLGIDSPDVPREAIDAIPKAIHTHDVAIGPATDGGYWSIAARRYHAELFKAIDWGTASVYDATCRRAAEAGLHLATLSRWPDVDRLSDLIALIERLRQPMMKADQPLHTLLNRLETIPAIKRDAEMHGTRGTDHD